MKLLMPLMLLKACKDLSKLFFEKIRGSLFTKLMEAFSPDANGARALSGGQEYFTRKLQKLI